MNQCGHSHEGKGQEHLRFVPMFSRRARPWPYRNIRAPEESALYGLVNQSRTLDRSSGAHAARQR